jgi:hypothetical protein
MNDTFLSVDPATSKQEIVDALYARLKDVRRALSVRVEPDDEFNLGINCAQVNEEFWLQTLIDKIERS